MHIDSASSLQTEAELVHFPQQMAFRTTQSLLNSKPSFVLHVLHDHVHLLEWPVPQSYPLSFCLAPLVYPVVLCFQTPHDKLHTLSRGTCCYACQPQCAMSLYMAKIQYIWSELSKSCHPPQASTVAYSEVIMELSDYNIRWEVFAIPQLSMYIQRVKYSGRLP